MQQTIRKNKRYVYLIIIIAVGLTLYRFSPTAYWFWPKCPLRLMTGLSCPACGIQRFIHAFANGHFKEAIAYNYYLVYALPYTIMLILIYYLPDSPLKQRLTGIFECKKAIWLYVVTFCLWFVIRNLYKI